MDLPADRLTPERRKMLRRAAAVAFLLFPLVLPSNFANMGVRTAIWVLALLSLVVLTGWVGQVSLAQAAFMGIGAFSAAQASRHLGIDYPWHAFVAGAFAAGTALLIGMAALRIRGLYLAIATLAFQWMMEASFLEWHPISGGFNGVGIDPFKLGPYDFSSDRLFFYFAWATAFLVLVLTANLRDSKTGRAWFAIRGSEIAAKTLGIDVMRYKLTAFAVSGFIVGVAGSINLNFIGQATPFDYNFTKSITYLGVAVLGGIGAIAGAVVGALAFVISDQLIFTSIDALRGKIDIAAAGLLIFTILRNPGGMITMVEDVKEKIAVSRARRALRAGQEKETSKEHVSAPLPRVSEEHESLSAEPALAGAGRGNPPPVSGGAGGDPTIDRSGRLRAYVETRGERTRRLETPPVLVARDVTIRFGGVVANDGVNLEVRQGEICGLIGPNGAGKTTFFNAVNGLLVPNDGTVFFGGSDITAKPIHERAAMGMSRTFQIMRLVTRLTVFENLMIATHLQNDSGFLDNMLMRKRSVADDRRNAERVREILSFLGIAEHADRKISSLPFGILRLVELGRALVTQPTLLLLDEPASGLDVRETDAFAEHLFRIRDEMGHTILLIEHDMRLVMMVADYVYVLEFGRNLAEGLPSSIQRNTAVIAAYLGEESVA